MLHSHRPVALAIVGSLAVLALLSKVGLAQAPQVVKAGAGSYLVAPTGGQWSGPSAEIYMTERLRAAPGGRAVPTNDWCSSLVVSPFSQPMYPHPLAVRASEDGLTVGYPGANIHATDRVVFAGLGRGDLTLGPMGGGKFADARLDGQSDWMVRARFTPKDTAPAMNATFGHGCPFVYVTFEGPGGVAIRFHQRPKVWAGEGNDAARGVTIGESHYGLFGPTGSLWSESTGGDGSVTWMNCSAGKPYFSLAALPDAKPETLRRFARVAHTHVVETRFTARYDDASGAVETSYRWVTQPREGDVTETIFALYPHQWRDMTAPPVLDGEYQSVRGPMKLIQGNQFTVRRPFRGVLPVLPAASSSPSATPDTRLIELLAEESRNSNTHPKDTYWEGKRIGHLGTLVLLAEQAGPTAAKTGEVFRQELKTRLERWLSAVDADGSIGRSQVFRYDPTWGTLIGHPASYGSDKELNDHHFHYGYFVHGAAVMAMVNPKWAEEYGPMVELITRDFATPDRADPMFPWLRNFDPYAGHSWASGLAMFADGNNQESSSEAIAAWYAMILWGEATGNRRIRDTGIILYTLETTAVDAYWFDITGENYPAEFRRPCVGLVWGGKAGYETWFSGRPEAIHGINWLPLHGGSLYLARSPEYLRTNLEAMRDAAGGDRWEMWSDLIWMVQSLVDPEGAMRAFEARPAGLKAEAGGSLAHTWHWIRTMQRLGQVNQDVTADHPLYAVFDQANRRTYVVYSMHETPQRVRFSDGFAMEASGKGPKMVTRVIPSDAP